MLIPVSSAYFSLFVPDVAAPVTVTFTCTLVQQQ